MGEKKGADLRGSGRDIDAGEREVELIKKSVQATYTRGVLGIWAALAACSA